MGGKERIGRVSSVERRVSEVGRFDSQREKVVRQEGIIGLVGREGG